MIEDKKEDTLLKRIAIQGFAGAFHEIAAKRYHEKNEVDIIPASTFEEMIRIAEDQNMSDGGMMAIENSIAGSLMYNYTLLHESQLKVSGEIFLRIKHNLMAIPGQQIEDIKEVYSHPMAIAQCRVFFKQYPHIRLIEDVDTALSAKMIQEKKMIGAGAIASSLAADLYDMEILAASIETNKRNFTRFLVLDKDDKKIQELPKKVSVCFSTPHKVGSLHSVLGALVGNHANMTKIQSVPIVGSEWQYRFFVDFVLEHPVMFSKTIDDLKRLTKELKILGTYEIGQYHES